MHRFTLRVGALIALIALAASTIVSVSFARSKTIDDAAKVLVKLDDEWSSAAATRDASKVAAYYTDGAIAYPPGAPMAVGRAAAEKVWADYFTEPTFVISWKTSHAGLSKSGDLGFTSGTYEASWKGADGKQVVERGKYLCTWQKQPDGSWKATHDMWNADTK